MAKPELLEAIFAARLDTAQGGKFLILVDDELEKKKRKKREKERAQRAKRCVEALKHKRRGMVEEALATLSATTR